MMVLMVLVLAALLVGHAEDPHPEERGPGRLRARIETVEVDAGVRPATMTWVEEV